MYSAGHSGLLRQKAAWQPLLYCRILPLSPRILIVAESCSFSFCYISKYYFTYFKCLTSLKSSRNYYCIPIIFLSISPNSFPSISGMTTSTTYHSSLSYHTLPSFITQIKCMATTATANTDARSCKKLAT